MITTLLPTYNEKDNIIPLIEDIFRAVGLDSEIIVVDDDSPDGTWKEVEKLARSVPNLRLLRRIEEKGLVSALQEGISASRGDTIVWMDCDFSMPPSKIPDLLAEIDAGFDMAVGSRFVEGGGVEIVTGSQDSIISFLMSLFLNKFIRTVLISDFKDYTSGFVAARKAVLLDTPLRGDYGEYFIDLAYRAIKRGYRVKEIPYLCAARRRGQSKTGTNIFHYFQKGIKYIVVTLRLRFSKIRPRK